MKASALILIMSHFCFLGVVLCVDQQQRIIESPTNTYAKLGDNGIMLKCKFDQLKGEPQWCFDDFCLRINKADMTLKGRPRHRIVGNHTNGEYNLIIDNIQLQDNMFYYCMATAASETIQAVKSDKAFLTVLTSPELIHLDDPLHVSLNKASTIGCVARRSRPAVKLYFSINNQLIDDDTKYKTTIVQMPTANSQYTNSELKKLPFYEQIKYFYYDTFINLTLDDVNIQLSGKKIECIAYEIPITNLSMSVPFRHKPIMTKVSTIQVNYAPEVNLKLISTNKVLQENDVITLSCETRAMPAVQSYKWYLGKNYINGVNDDKLNLKLRREMNLKTITCEAINIVAAVKASLVLHVHFKPYFIHSTEQFLLYDAKICQKQITLDCQTNANPHANITWFKENQQIGYGPTFTIPAFNCGHRFRNYSNIFGRFGGRSGRDYEEAGVDDGDDDFGLYVCEANNGVVTQAIVEEDTNKRFIKINPLGKPSLRLMTSGSSDSTADYHTHNNIVYTNLGKTLHLTCLVDPLPQFSKIVWYKNDQKLFNSNYVDTNMMAKEDAVDDDDEDTSGDYTTNDSNVALNENIDIKYVNTTQGLKSLFKLQINTKSDFATYSCKVSNRWGTREQHIHVRENQQSTLGHHFNFKLKIYLFLAVALGIILVAMLVIIICVNRYFCKTKAKRASDRKDSATAVKDCSLSTNIMINENASTGTNSEKTINEWLIHTSSNASTSSPDPMLGHNKPHSFLCPTAQQLGGVDHDDDTDEHDELLMARKMSPLALSSPASKSYYLSDLFQSPPSHSSSVATTTAGSNFKPNGTTLQIHSNMKSVPYTTLTRLYQNSNGLLSSPPGNTNATQSPLIKLKFNENMKCLGVSTTPSNINFQTIV